MTDTVSCRVVVAHPWRLAREALEVAIASAGHQVVAVAHDEASLVEATQGEHPDVVLADEHFGGEGAPALWETIRVEHGSRLLVLAREADQGALLRVIEAGSDGFLTNDLDLAQLSRAVASVMAGETYIPPGMLGLLLRELIVRRRNEDGVLDRFSRVSRREREILELMVAGASHQRMAEVLFLSPHTVRTHVQKVIEKLGVHSRTEAVAMVVEYDLLNRFGSSAPS